LLSLLPRKQSASLAFRAEDGYTFSSYRSLEHLPRKAALPHGKSSFVCFKHLLSSDSALVCPPRPQRRSSALEREKNLASVKEKEKDVS
jgi:hypothetical protein